MIDPNLHPWLLRHPNKCKFSVLDFHTYEEVCDHFLWANPCIGCAALMAGGLLWRLAVETIEQDLVLDSPDSLGYACGITFTLCDSADNVFMDNSLTEAEICIIIRTYIQEPKHWNNFDGAGYPMWWPGGAFEESSLDFG